MQRLALIKEKLALNIADANLRAVDDKSDIFVQSSYRFSPFNNLLAYLKNRIAFSELSQISLYTNIYVRDLFYFYTDNTDYKIGRTEYWDYCLQKFTVLQCKQRVSAR